MIKYKKTLSISSAVCRNYGMNISINSCSSNNKLAYSAIFLVMLMLSLSGCNDEEKNRKTFKKKLTPEEISFNQCKKIKFEAFRAYGASFLDADQKAHTTCVIERERRKNGVYDWHLEHSI